MHQVVVIGAGFGGIGMAIALKRAGRHDFVVLECADDLGGAGSTCRCEMPAHVRAFSFEPHPGRTPLLVTRPRVAEYLRHCADKYEVKPHIRYNTDVVAAVYDEATATWSVDTADGASYRARAVVMAGGPEVACAEPSGRGSFPSEALHTSRAHRVGVCRRAGRVERWIFARLPLPQMLYRGAVRAGLAGFADAVARPHLPACLTPAADRTSAGASTVVGRDGRRLDEVASDDHLAVTGFPNLLLLPEAGRSVFSIERRIDHAALALGMLDDVVSIEVRPEARRARGGLRAWLRRALWCVGGCVSWYRGPWGTGDFEIRPHD